MTRKLKISPEEGVKQKKIINKRTDLNKMMEAFSYPKFGMTIYANSKEDADEQIKIFQK